MEGECECELSEQKNENVSAKMTKKSKRKINGHCEAPIDKKIVKLEEAEVLKNSTRKDEDDSQQISEKSVQNGDRLNGEKISENSIENDSDPKEATENDKSQNDSGSRITGKYIRKILNGPGGIGILRKFVSICNNEKESEKYDLAGEYLEAKGSLLELLRLLDGADKKNSANAAIIFSAMQIIILKIISKYPQYLTNAEEACRHFINSHLSSVHSMFSSQSIPQHRKICLRLLTAIVSLGGNLPRELLGHLSFHSQTLELLCQHTKPTDSNNVRTSFIHFIISFLIDGSINVIRTLLDKHGMLSSIFPGLIYDSSTVVHLVLNTVKNYLLMNNLVSKTAKLHLFSTPVVQNLVNLYNWKGPTQWPGNNPRKFKPITQSVDPEDKQIAVEAVHEFLLLLLTSTRYGIIFNDKSLGTSGRKHNQLANSILQSLDKPWEHEKPRELVTKILSSTPDLIKSQLIYMEPLMTPRLSKKWIQLMQFTREIITGINYELVLIPNLRELTFSQLISATLTFTAPKIVIKSAITPALMHSNIILRHEAILMMKMMIEQIKKIFELLKNNNSLDENEFAKFKMNICDYLVKNLPNSMEILQSWEKTYIENNEDDKTEDLQMEIYSPTRLEHFSIIIDLLELNRDIFPDYFKEVNENANEMENKNGNIDPMILLNGLKTIENENNENFNRIKIKVIEFIISINSDSFITNKELLSDSLSFLISLLMNDKFEIDKNAMNAIERILISSKTFNGNEEQIEIWINCFKLLDNNNEDQKHEVGEWFVKLLLRAMKKSEKYSNKIPTVQDDILQQSQSIPLLYYAAIDNLMKYPNENIANYLSFVSILTLHCQINPEMMLKLTENIELLPNKYLTSWNTSSGNYIKKPFGCDDLIRKYSKSLLNNETIEWKNKFGGYENMKINYNDELINIDYSLTNYEILTMWRMTLFYLTQSLRHLKIDNEQFERYKMAVIVLLNIAMKSTNEKELMRQLLKQIYTNPILLQYFSPLSLEKNPLELIITNELIFPISKMIKEIDEFCLLFNEINLPFKLKFLSQFKLLIVKSMNGWRINEGINLNKFLEIFQLNSSDILNLLNSIFELSNKIILSIDKNNLSAWGEIVPKLIELQLKNGNDSDESSVMIKKMFNQLSLLLIKSKANIDNWIEVLHKYLMKYPRYFVHIDGKFFKFIIQRELTSPLINFIGLIINRNEKLISQLVEHVTKTNSHLLKHSELIFSIISSNLHHKWNTEFLNTIFQQYKNDFVDYFVCKTTDNVKFIDKNIKSIKYLINSIFNSEICEKIIENILLNGDKLDNVDINYIELLQTLIKRTSKLNEKLNQSESTINFIQILIRIGVCALKKYSTNDIERLQLICSYICESIDDLKLINNEIIIDDINKNNSWPQFSRFSLKIGLKVNKNTTNVIKSTTILKTLAKICSIAYENNSNNEYVKTLFEMTSTHSEFMNIMIGNDSIQKCELLELIFVLVRKNYSLMTQKHIPLYLSSYNATLTKSDQIILMILQHYEREKISFNDYKPYFWGESAVNYYSIKGDADTALWRQPTTTQIFDLFNNEIVERTIRNFPINRKLNSNTLIDDCNVHCDVYDPAFYLPLFNYLMADNNIVICNKVTQNGVLSLVFSACSSLCDDVKIAAFNVLSRFYFHLEGTSHKERLLWMRIIDGLRNGLSLSIKETKISCLVSTFLAEASLVSTQPLNPLYARIQSFFMAKPALDLNTIPEFLILFHSSEINHKIYRHWILKVIRDGIKSEFDVDLAMKCVLFRMIFDFYHCVLADLQTKNLILEIVNSSVKIRKGKLLLMRNYSLAVWLDNVVKKIEKQDLTGIKLIINIIENLIDMKMQNNDREHNEFLLLTILKNLISKLTKNFDADIFNNYLTLLNNLTDVKLFSRIIEKSDIEFLICLSTKIIIKIDVDECKNMLNDGCVFINRNEFNFHDKNNNSINNLIQFNLKKLIVNWHNSKSQKYEW